MNNEKVHHPPHYNQGQVEYCDAMESVFGKARLSDFCIMNALKYLWRCSDHRDGRSINIEKAQWYLSKAQSLSDE